MNQFIVIAGLSGAGRTQAAADLEDLGWFVIDNVPPALIPKVGELAGARGSAFDKVALVVRSEGIDDVLPALSALGATDLQVRMVFLEASTDALVRRYESTRRRHPYTDDGRTVADAIDWERELLQPLKAMADVVVDTSDLNVHQLSARIQELFGEEGDAGGMRVNVVSFGYKQGLPLDVDIVLDCRFLPNPHWVDSLREKDGRDAPVREFLTAQAEYEPFLEQIDGLLELLLPAYARERRMYLSIAVGCTGGRHRSVVVAEAIADLLRKRGLAPAVTHRDIDLPS